MPPFGFHGRVAAVAAVILSAFGNPGGWADSTKELEYEIPAARFYSPSVWSGTYIYTFGGALQNGTVVRDILRYDPAAGGNATKIADLPVAVHSAAAIWDGSAAFIFGGDEPGNDPGDGTRIVAFTPANNTAWNVSTAFLPSSRLIPSAVWTGQYAYIIGGSPGGGVYRDDVVRFNTVTFAVDVVLNSTINATHAERIKRGSTSAVWDGEHAYVFGGNGCFPPPNPDDVCRHIVRFTPGNNTTAFVGAELPVNSSGTAAAWDGLAAYLFGNGSEGGGTIGTDKIYRYRPATDTVTTMSATLPQPRKFTSAVWNGTFAYVLTGKTQLDWPKRIVIYNLTPGKPLDLILNSAAEPPVEIGLQWLAPANNTYTDSITNYTLYRNPAGFAVNKVIQLGNVTSHTDNDGLTFGTTYCYNITATNARGEGPPYPALLDPPRCAVGW